MKGAIYVEGSANSKLGKGKLDGTYTSIYGTCPKSCKLMGESCYAELSFCGITSRRLDNEAKGMTALQLARSEAVAIDNSYNGGKIPEGRCLRLHVAGDSRTVAGTRMINAAIKRWKKRGGKYAFSYTHAWQTVHRDEWEHVSVLASVDSIEDVANAKKRGYAPAIIVIEHLSDKVYTIEGSNVKWIPCPAQTRKIDCATCKLCMNSSYLEQSNHGIALSIHGVRKNNFKRRLDIIK
jgi:hypothetical protein